MQGIQSPRIFLAKPEPQDPGVVDVVDVVVVAVVVIATQLLSTSLKPSSHKQSGKPSIRDAFSLQVQVSPGRGSSKTPMQEIHSPRIFRVCPELQAKVVVVVVVVVVDVVEVVVTATQ